MRIYFDKILILFHVSHGFSVPSSYSRQVSIPLTGFLFCQHGFSHDFSFTQNERSFLLTISTWKILPAHVPLPVVMDPLWERPPEVKHEWEK